VKIGLLPFWKIGYILLKEKANSHCKDLFALNHDLVLDNNVENKEMKNESSC
jgi:hypothetical protein